MKKFGSADYLRFITARYKVLDESALETFMEVLSVSKAMNCGMDAYFQRMGISHARFKVMINLLYHEADGGTSPATLAEILGVKRATVTGILDTLENDKWIERHPDPNDRRGLLIRITEAGIAKLDSVLPAHYERISRAMGTLTLSEQEQLRVLIRKFGSGLDVMESALGGSDEDQTNQENEVD